MSGIQWVQATIVSLIVVFAGAVAVGAECTSEITGTMGSEEFTGTLVGEATFDLDVPVIGFFDGRLVATVYTIEMHYGRYLLSDGSMVTLQC